MSQLTESLWSPDIRPGILAPRGILDSQAKALREQTGGLLAGDVRAVFDEAEGAAYLTFDLLVPALHNERHRILMVRSRGDRVYPCHLDADGLRAAEIAHSDEEFQAIIRDVLHSGEVKSLALSLIARARDARRPETPVFVRRHRGHQRLFRPAWAGVETEEDAGCLVDALYDEPQGID